MADFEYTLRIDARALDKAVGPMLARSAASITRRIAAQAKINVPVDTGFLGRSIEELPIRFPTPLTAESGVAATANYARYVHEGTRPHVIRPRNARVLAWPQPNPTNFARLVHHPGTTARPFLRNAADSVVRGGGLT